MKVTIELSNAAYESLARKPAYELTNVEGLVWEAIPQLPKKGEHYTFKRAYGTYEVYWCDGTYVILLSGTRNNRYPHVLPLEDFYKDWSRV